MAIRKADEKGKPKRGSRGGNRGGERTVAAKVPKKTSQAAGKDPTRGKGRTSR